jgi:hypothetical protein
MSNLRSHAETEGAHGLRASTLRKRCVHLLYHFVELLCHFLAPLQHICQPLQNLTAPTQQRSTSHTGIQTCSRTLIVQTRTSAVGKIRSVVARYLIQALEFRDISCLCFHTRSRHAHQPKPAPRYHPSSRFAHKHQLLRSVLLPVHRAIKFQISESANPSESNPSTRSSIRLHECLIV